ncbi:MAG TPA: magnesium transporter CorA family protein [Actinospica sp.]|jgi:magnesium transporter|nr:magnesium transporter CorA family protein [Actinospica sp.]
MADEPVDTVQDGRSPDGDAAGGAEPGRRSRAYRAGKLVAEDFPLADVSEWIEHPDAAVWYDLRDPTPAELDELRTELGLHSLAIEDAEHLRQRPKVDRYEGHVVLSAYRVRANAKGDLDAKEVLAFITPRALITVHEPGALDLDVMLRRWDDSPELIGYGLPFLVYGLLDYIVDGYFEALQTLDDTIEDISDLIFETASGRESADALRQTFDLRRGLLTARHVITPMREVVNALMRRDWSHLNAELLPYYQDLYDHVLRAADWTDNLRDLLVTVRETQLTIQGNRMNLIMKKVTSWAAIIAVPTAVTGFYGQNVPYPGFNTTHGFWASSALILVLSTVLYLAFKRRDWL